MLRHGYLREQENILINDNHHACLADFGLTKIVSDTLYGYPTTIWSGWNSRWMAPELLDPKSFGLANCTPTTMSDIYAFGMVVYEVLYFYFISFFVSTDVVLKGHC
jgi:serine/threonine protein kinase